MRALILCFGGGVFDYFFCFFYIFVFAIFDCFSACFFLNISEYFPLPLAFILSFTLNCPSYFPPLKNLSSVIFSASCLRTIPSKSGFLSANYPSLCGISPVSHYYCLICLYLISFADWIVLVMKNVHFFISSFSVSPLWISMKSWTQNIKKINLKTACLLKFKSWN